MSRLRPPDRPRPSAVAPSATQRRSVLFVCIGNSCRSQMAEAFARSYGADVIAPQSAGLAHATMIAPLTRKVLTERGLDTSNQFPKSIFEVRGPFDLIINISGEPLPKPFDTLPSREWKVQDPIGGQEALHAEVARILERKVMDLVLEIRTAATAGSGRAPTA